MVGITILSISVKYINIELRGDTGVKICEIFVFLE